MWTKNVINLPFTYYVLNKLHHTLDLLIGRSQYDEMVGGSRNNSNKYFFFYTVFIYYEYYEQKLINCVKKVNLGPTDSPWILHCSMDQNIKLKLR